MESVQAAPDSSKYCLLRVEWKIITSLIWNRNLTRFPRRFELHSPSLVKGETTKNSFPNSLFYPSCNPSVFNDWPNESDQPSSRTPSVPDSAVPPQESMPEPPEYSVPSEPPVGFLTSHILSGIIRETWPRSRSVWKTLQRALHIELWLLSAGFPTRYTLLPPIVCTWRTAYPPWNQN